MARMKVAYSDDCSILSVLEPADAVATVHRFLDWTTERIPIDYWALLSACPDVCMYRTRAGEIMGQRLDPGDRSVFTRGMDLLLQQGTDLLQLYLDRLRDKGIKVLAEIRMSDTHHKDHLWENRGLPDLQHRAPALRDSATRRHQGGRAGLQPRGGSRASTRDHAGARPGTRRRRPGAQLHALGQALRARPRP